jgi:glycosyltransferase involved in cell wall biosynthesis
MSTIIYVPRRYTKSEWGGTETVIAKTSNELKKLGDNISIYTSMAFSTNREELLYGTNIKRFNYTYARFNLKDKNKRLLDKRGGDLYSWSLFWSLLTKKDISIFHLHTSNRIGAMIRLISRLRGIPYGITLHGGVLDIPDSEIKKMIEPLKSTFNWGKLLDIVLQKNKVLEDSSFIICVSDEERKKLEIKYKNNKIYYLPNGVDLERFNITNKVEAKQALSYNANDQLILSVAAFYEQKNQLILLEAFLKVSKYNSNAKLLLIGVVYDDIYYQKILDFISNYKLDNKVSIMKNLTFDSKQLTLAYEASDVFVLASKYETFGIVILEAWAAKTPAICAEVGGMKKFVKNKENSLFFDLNNTKDLEKKINTLLEDKKFHDFLANNAFNAVQDYSWKNISVKIQEIYQRELK